MVSPSISWHGNRNPSRGVGLRLFGVDAGRQPPPARHAWNFREPYVDSSHVTHESNADELGRQRSTRFRGALI